MFRERNQYPFPTGTQFVNTLLQRKPSLSFNPRRPDDPWFCESVIDADAYNEAEKTRGDGDARSASIYADAFNKDPEFYTFYRSINAYVNVFNSKSDMLVLRPDTR